MAHHKRRRPKSRRAGCLSCKPHKRQGVGKKARTRIQHLRKMQDAE